MCREGGNYKGQQIKDFIRRVYCEGFKLTQQSEGNVTVIEAACEKLAKEMEGAVPKVLYGEQEIPSPEFNQKVVSS